MPKHIIIIGAGISGLTLAYFLQGFYGKKVVKIYEKRSAMELEAGSKGGGLGIWPDGAEVLLNLPCGAEIQKLAGDLTKEYWGNAKGETLRVVNREKFRQINGFPIINLSRNELWQMLLTLVGKENVTFNAKLTKLKQADGVVTLDFNNTGSMQASLVIGADGTFSTVRKSISQTPLNYTGYIAFVGLCKFLPHEKPTHHMIWGENRFLLVFPISRDRHVIYAVRPLPQGYLAKLKTPEEQISLFFGWSNEVDRILLGLKRCLLEPEYRQHASCHENYDMPPLPSLYKGRVALIGDAAHPCGSLMGLNLNAGLRDCKSLAYHLIHEKDIDHALQKFSAQRILHISEMIAFENEKKEFLLKESKKDYSEFEAMAKSASDDEFFDRLFQIIRSKPIMSDSCVQKLSMFRFSEKKQNPHDKVEKPTKSVNENLPNAIRSKL